MDADDDHDSERQPTPQTPAAELARSIEARREDAAFRTRLQASLARFRGVLERLSR